MWYPLGEFYTEEDGVDTTTFARYKILGQNII